MLELRTLLLSPPPTASRPSSGRRCLLLVFVFVFVVLLFALTRVASDSGLPLDGGEEEKEAVGTVEGRGGRKDCGGTPSS